jgi:hypothetical protein
LASRINCATHAVSGQQRWRLMVGSNCGPLLCCQLPCPATQLKRSPPAIAPDNQAFRSSRLGAVDRSTNTWQSGRRCGRHRDTPAPVATRIDETRAHMQGSAGWPPAPARGSSQSLFCLRRRRHIAMPKPPRTLPIKGKAAGSGVGRGVFPVVSPVVVSNTKFVSFRIYCS